MTRPNLAAAGAQVAAAASGSNGTAHAESLVESYRRLAEVFHHVLSEQSVDMLLDRIADTLADLVPYDDLHIYEADVPQRLLVPVLARSEWAEEIMRDRGSFGEGITGWAVEHRQPVWTNQAQLDPRVKIVPGTPSEPEAMITVPLIARGQVKGALNIYRIGEEARFHEHEFELTKWFGDAAALALDNAQVRARLEHQAQTDSLTGLYNHRFFHERLRSELTRAHRTHDAVALLMFDIDDFKKVNDIYGHGAGDQILISLARLAREIVRGSDVVCRLGGEEFGVIMPSCTAGDALGLARRLTDRLAETAFDPAGVLSVSIGIAQGPEHATNPRELVACAEAAMMTAKARGKAKVVLFDDSTRDRPAATAGRDVRSIAHLKLLQSLAGKLNRLNDVREIGQAIAGELRLLIDYHSCRVFVRDGDDLIPVAHLGDLEPADLPLAEVLAMKVGEGITGRVAATGESMLVGDAVNCEHAVTLAGTSEIDESLAAVPLKFGQRVIGVLVISKLGLDQFDEDDVRLLEVLAGHASVALENARLYQAQRREAENAKALLELADAMAKAPSFDAVSEQSVHTVARLLGALETSLWMRSIHTGGFECVAHRGAAEGAGNCAPVSREEGEALLAGRTGPFLAAAAPGVTSAGSIAVSPIDQSGGIRGWLTTVLPEAPSEDRLRLLAGVAGQAGVALEKARLYREQTVTAEIANALLDFSRQLVRADGTAEVLERVAELAARALGSSRCSVWIQEAETGDLRVATTWGYPREEAEQMAEASYSADVVSAWLDRTEPFLLLPEDLAAIANVPEHRRAERFAIAPMLVEGGRAGCIAVTVEDELDERRMRLLAGLAQQARLAIESAFSFEQLEETFVSTVEALANALEANDEYTSSHARWIRDRSLHVGLQLRLEPRALKRLELGALFHDIGKIGIPSEILRKPGPLTPEERLIVEQHPVLGERILAPIDRLADVRPVVRACHERWDGHGYPDGLAAEEIPVEARIIFVCDAFHAMTTDRPYRGRLSDEEACRRLRAAAGSQFDPAVVDAFVRAHETAPRLPEQ